ncbi:DUF418 domain-containing protein [Mesobacillus zeae]|uniref:DUF418 domain-containing protein n=1 Tax=Mesobacillus zeae TaxID=1917180 RepID=UPI0030095FDA
MKRRIEYLDAVRGLSVIGILLVNIHSFSWPEIYDSIPSAYWSSEFEQKIHHFLSVFIQSSFYPLFALLFGISMNFIFKGAAARGLNPYIIFSKRLIFLFLLGGFHAFFIWYGDILMVYAVLGFLLLPCYKLSKEKLFLFGLLLWLLPNALYGGFLFISDPNLENGSNLPIIKVVIENYINGMTGRFTQNLIDWLYLYNAESWPFIFVSIFPMFLLGLSIAKSDWTTWIQTHPAKIKKMWFLSGGLGLALKILPLINPLYLLYHHIAEAFGGPILGLFYALTVIRLSSKSKRFIKGLSSIGRMSLSNYLFQSIIGWTIYKGLHLYGEIPASINILIALLIVFLQTILSRIWLLSHSSGPIEQIWNRATYGQNIKMKNSLKPFH